MKRFVPLVVALCVASCDGGEKPCRLTPRAGILDSLEMATPSEAPAVEDRLAALGVEHYDEIIQGLRRDSPELRERVGRVLARLKVPAKDLGEWELASHFPQPLDLLLDDSEQIRRFCPAVLREGTVDPETQVILIIHMGRRPSTDYAVEFSGARLLQDGTLSVAYQCREPSPGQLVGAEETYPHMMVALPRIRTDVRVSGDGNEWLYERESASEAMRALAKDPARKGEILLDRSWYKRCAFAGVAGAWESADDGPLLLELARDYHPLVSLRAVESMLKRASLFGLADVDALCRPLSGGDRKDIPKLLALVRMAGTYSGPEALRFFRFTLVKRGAYHDSSLSGARSLGLCRLMTSLADLRVEISAAHVAERDGVLDALGASEDPHSLRGLIALLEHPVAEVRGRALRCLKARWHDQGLASVDSTATGADVQRLWETANANLSKLKWSPGVRKFVVSE